MVRQRSVFDIVGPVMVGPSSSHTAGAVRLGALARGIAGGEVRSAAVTLHGSFAATGRGHGTDVALVAGLLGYAPDDARIPQAFAHAEQAGMQVTFAEADLGDVHPNTARIEVDTTTGTAVLVQGSSVGAGDVEITLIDDFPVHLTGELPAIGVVHHDQPGVVAAVSARLAASDINIASMQVFRERRGARALMVIETDEPVGDEVATGIGALPGIITVRAVPAV
ncbi:MAG: L-serine ammonia-lyase, iron-sulfur-dependent subunit beta [Actinomycetota bacterium]|nr:L-serine ammonia-lyase, iron-sulfur-dependent subunit beta [Actinomycetota bacterium]